MLTSTSLVLILISVLELSSAAAQCQNNWKMFQSSCYGFGDQLLTYAEATSICNREGAELVEINSEEENSYVATFLQSNVAHNVWIGNTDLFHEGSWAYSSSGTLVSFTKWSPNQPDNYNGMEDCSAMNKENKLWYDLHCGTRLYFLCELKQ